VAYVDPWDRASCVDDWTLLPVCGKVLGMNTSITGLDKPNAVAAIIWLFGYAAVVERQTLITNAPTHIIVIAIHVIY
jgi:hypothetical protein